jgi:hypothetical protein
MLCLLGSWKGWFRVRSGLRDGGGDSQPCGSWSLVRSSVAKWSVSRLPKGRYPMRLWIGSRRVVFAHWRQERRRRRHRRRPRELLCRLHIHWPRSWEPAAEGDRAAEELLCQVCRYRLNVRVVPERPVATLAASPFMRPPDGAYDANDLNGRPGTLTSYVEFDTMRTGYDAACPGCGHVVGLSPSAYPIGGEPGEGYATRLTCDTPISFGGCCGWKGRLEAGRWVPDRT